MSQRMDLAKVQPGIFDAMYKLKGYLAITSIPPSLQELVFIRASQLNQCGFCLDMHAVRALEMGVPARSLVLVNTWHEAHAHFTAAERAALAFTDEVTHISEGGVSDAAYAAVVNAFGESGAAELLMAIITINNWNRLMVAVRRDF
ncbi:hypothetical protein DCC81_16985 [Chitinophaga parva]|uniref:Carboxymuconolactone decarboxylase-like domain-containing protein n=1 Tax=Chitinophaga parva TaxID=2169414 RepID=A0A2T7BI29_9BACT|nr:carboxymuconolactone decarboxylase family protein [Chitinophaga parva]PUZ25939.1 hypothetical protein DCC81_16985 [Chitinophaga parva]